MQIRFIVPRVENFGILFLDALLFFYDKMEVIQLLYQQLSATEEPLLTVISVYTTKKSIYMVDVQY